MITVFEVLTKRRVALCIDCVITLTGLRADDGIDQLNALPLCVTEGLCDDCGTLKAIFAYPANMRASG